MNVLKRNRIEVIGITQYEMAQRLNVSLATVRAWEQGVKHIKLKDLSSVTRAYNFNITDLMEYIKECSKYSNIEYSL